MAASNVFTNMLKSIEESELNYSMTKTPFSVKISLKCSFVKRFNEASKISNVGNLEKLSRKDFPNDVKKIGELENEILELQNEIKRLDISFKKNQKTKTEEVVSMQKFYDEENERSKALEVKLAESREEALKVKKERNNMKKTFKLANETLESEQFKSESLIKDNVALRKMFEDQTERLDFKSEEVIKTKKENETIKSDLNNIKAELEDLNQVNLNKVKSGSNATNVISVLRAVMILRYITKFPTVIFNKASQYEQERSFEIFNCFYCNVTIDSEDQLELHHLTCQKELHSLVKPQAMYQAKKTNTCEICGTKCRDKDDLKRHLAMYHYLQVVPEEPETEYYKCDICPLI